MSRVLVTGANGFIGRYIVDALCKNNIVIGTGRQEKSNSNCYKYIRCDLVNDNIVEYMKEEEIDCIIHAAAAIDKDDLSEQLISTNCLGTFKIVEYAKVCNAKYIVYISGLPIIGIPHKVPITEDALVVPNSMYHATKAAGELIINQAKNFGIRVSSLRVPSPIGPGMPANTIVPTFVKRVMNGDDIVIHGKGTRKQNYIDVRDIGEAVKRIVQRDGLDGTFNVGAKNIISNIDLANLCIDLLKSHSNISFSGKEDVFDGVDWTADDSKLRSFIGEYQEYSIDRSIIDISRGLL